MKFKNCLTVLVVGLCLFLLVAVSTAHPQTGSSYVLISEKDAQAAWTSFSEAKVGIDKQLDSQTRILKFSVVRPDQKVLNLLVNCSGVCTSFTCAKEGEIFRPGCLPSATCNRQEFLSKDSPSFGSREWLDSVTPEDLTIVKDSREIKNIVVWVSREVRSFFLRK